MTKQMTGYRTVSLLIPYVSEPAAGSPLFHFRKCLITAKSVENENPTALQRLVNTSEISRQDGALLKYPVAEVKGGNDIDRPGSHAQNIGVYESGPASAE